MSNLMNRDISWITFQHRVLDQAKWRGTHDALVFLGISASNTEEFLSVRYPKFISSRSDKKMKLMIDAIGAYYQRYDNIAKDKDVSLSLEKCSKSDIKELKSIYDSNYSDLKQYDIRKEDTVDKIIPNILYCLVNGKYIVKIPNNIRMFTFGKKIVLAETLLKYFNKDIKSCTPFTICRSVDEFHYDGENGDNAKSNITAVEINPDSKDDLTKIVEFLNIGKYTIVHKTKYVKMASLKSIDKDFLGGSKISYKGVNTFTKKSSFDYIKKGDRLLFHPYESYDKSVVKFIRDAAEDKNVTHIRILLYRVAYASKIIKALSDAAKAGKKVDVVIELKVRFDEKHNKLLAKDMEKHGVNVIYTPEDIKTHAKACLVIRKEKGKKQYYSHISTGNYNEKNARLYTDYSFFTADNDIGRDIDKFINMVSGDKIFIPKNLIFSPYNLRETLYDLIDKAIELKSKGKKVELIFKTNAICDKDIAKRILKASSKGVKVCGIVRSSSIIGSGKNLSIISIVGDLLEHSRAYCLIVDGVPKRVYIGSSDLMPRNLNRRNEILVRIKDKKLMKKVYDNMSVYYGDKNSYTIMNDYKISRHKKGHTNSCFKAFEHEYRQSK